MAKLQLAVVIDISALFSCLTECVHSTYSGQWTL